MGGLESATVADLMPGSPEVLERLETGLSGFARVASGAVERVGGLEMGSWAGSAADEFRSVLGEVPRQLSDAAQAFGAAAAAVTAYASALRAAQAEAGRALERFRSGQVQTARWESAWEAYRRAQARADATEDPGSIRVPARPSSSDPGAWERVEAERMVVVARDTIEEAARAAREQLEAAGAAAPDEPGFWSRAWGQVVEVGRGAWDSTWGMAEFVWQVSPTRALIDPEGWSEDMAALGQGIIYGVTHPVEFAKAITNWDMWMENPARAFGQLVPDLILAVATAGGGTAATAARRGADAVDTLSDLGRAANRVQDITDGAGVVHRIPQGVSPAAFDEISTVLRNEVGHLSDDIVVHGSRATGAARSGSDIDVAIRLGPDEFEDFLGTQSRFRNPPNPGSAKEESLFHVLERGRIFAGEARMSSLARGLGESLDMPFDLAVVLRGGLFDQSPAIPIIGPGGIASMAAPAFSPITAAGTLGAVETIEGVDRLVEVGDG